MPLNFLRKKKTDAPPAEAAVAPVQTPVASRTGVAFDGLTEEWRLVGRMNMTPP